MFYYFYKSFDYMTHLPGLGLFQYISFRAILAAIFALGISIWGGKWMISYFKKFQINEDIRNLGLKGEKNKKNIPTMGGIIIIIAIVLPTIFFANLNNIYILLSLLSVFWMGIVGLLDDSFKVCISISG